MKRGFTLIEVLVAIFVLALLSSLITGATMSIMNTERDLDDLVDIHRTARVAMDRMSKDISQSFLSLNRSEEERTKTVFIGERDRILFAYVGNIPVHANSMETDQGVVEYTIGGSRDDRGGRMLIRRFKPFIDDDADSGGSRSVIAQHVKALRFEYFNPDDHGGDWESEWKADDPTTNIEPGYKLPPRVRIYLDLLDNEEITHSFVTQTSIYMQHPLIFGNPTNKKALEHELKKEAGKPRIPSLLGILGISPTTTTKPGTGGR